MTTEKLDKFVYYFAWLVLFPAIGIGFLISVIAPGVRLTVADILSRGFWMFVLLLIVYALVLYIKARHKK